MSTTVDNRVVEMQFNNAQFEQGVAQSMTTLDKLKESLKFKKSSDGLDNLSKSLQHIPTSGLENSIQTIASRFTTMGIIGTRVLQNLTDSAMRFGKKLVRSVMNPIVQGGKQRAMDLAQAKFTMEGLLGDAKKANEVVAVAGKSVDSTAYGLDEAASIAAQFTSSGITDLKKLESALRGVSGVAAMTGANYAEIGDVFVSVAARGKLMGADLNRLSVRGMNGAAALAKVLGKSEADIRDMVHKGEIDFNTFADAMDKAFGEQSKKSNETFTGALANMKAALKRIGADFYEFLLIDARDVFNAIRPKIKEIHGQLGGFIEFTKKAARGATDAIVKFIGSIDVSWIEGAANTVTKVFDGVFTGLKKTFGDNYITKDMWKAFKESAGDVSLFRKELKKTAREAGINIDEMVKKSGSFSNTLENGWLTKDIMDKTIARMQKMVKEGKISAKELDKVTAKVINGDYANGEERIKKLTKAGYDYGTVQNLVNKQLGSSVRHIEKQSDAYLKSHGYTNKEIKLLRELAKQAKQTGTPLNELMESLNRKTTGQMLLETVGNIFKGLKKTVSSVAKAFGKVFSSKHSSNIRGFVTKLWEMSKGFDLNKDSCKKLTDVFTSFFQIIKKLLDFGGRVISFLWDLASKIASLVVELAGAVDVGAALQTVLDGLLIVLNLLGKAFGFVKKVLVAVGKGIIKFIAGIKDFFGQVAKLDGVKRLGNELKNIGKAIAYFAYDKFKRIIDFFKDLFHIGDSSKPVDYSFLLTGIDFAANKLADFLEWIQTIPGKISKVFGDISAKFDTSGIDEYTSKVSSIPKSFTDARDKIGKIFSDIANTIKEKLSELTPEKILKYISLGALGAFVLGIIKLVNKLRSIIGGVDDVRFAIVDAIENVSKVFDAQAKDVSASAFKKIAEAIGILAASIFVLSLIDPDTLGNVVTNIAFLVLIIGLMQKLNSKASDAGAGIDNLKKYVVDKFTGILKGFTEKLGKAADKAALAALLVSVGVVLALINFIIIRIAKMNPEQYATGLAGVAGIMILLGIFIKEAAKFVKDAGAKTLAALSGTMISLGAVVLVLTAVVAILGVLPVDVLIKGIKSLTVITVLLGAFLGAAAFASSKGDASGIAAAALSVLLFASAIAMLTPVLLVLGVAGTVALKGLLALAMLTGLMIGLYAAIKYLADEKSIAGLLAMVAALTLLGIAAVIIGANFENALKGLIVFTAGLIALVLAGMAAESLAPGFIVLTGVLLAFGAAAAGIGIAALGIGVGLFFAALSVEAFGRALPALAEGVVKFFKIIIKNAPLIITGVLVIIASVAAAIVAGSAAIGAAVLAVLVGIIYTIVQNWPAIWETIKSVGKWIVESLPDIFLNILGGILDGVGWLITHIPDILKKLAIGVTILMTKLLIKIERAIADGIESLIGGNWLSDKINATADETEKALEKVDTDTKKVGEGTKDSVEKNLEGVPDVFGQTGTDSAASFENGVDGINVTDIAQGKSEQFADGFNISDTVGSEVDLSQAKIDGLNFDNLDTNNVLKNGGTAEYFNNLQNSSDKTSKSFKQTNEELNKLGSGMDTSKVEKSSEKVVKATDISKKVGTNVKATNDELSKLGNVAPDVSKVTNAAKKFLKSVSISDKVEDAVDKSNKAAGKLGDVDAKVEVGKADTSKLTKSLNDAGKSSKKSGKEAGKSYISSFNDVISKASGTKSAGEKAAKKAVSGAKSTKGDFKAAGRYAISGFNEGANALARSLYEKGVQVGKQFVKGVKSGKALNEHSPSKALYEAGSFAIKGLINGVDHLMGAVARKGEETGNVAKNSIIAAVSDVSSLFDLGFDDAPVITPVIDMTNVKRGVNDINNSFGARTIGLSANVLNSANAMAAGANRIQNGTTNADVVSAINRLRGDIGNIKGDTYNVNGITYDDGANIHEAIGTLIRATVVEGRA